MTRRLLHMTLAFLVLAQPLASVSAWAAMQAADYPAVSESQAAEDLPPCHETSGDTATVGVPDCCEGMSGASCGMDCGVASSAVNGSSVPSSVGGHGAYAAALLYAAPSQPVTSLFKPPRIS